MYQRKSDGLWCEKVPGRSSPITCKTKAGLKKKLLNYNQQVEKGMLISDALDKWIASIEKDLSYKGRENYNSPIKRLKEAFGDRYAMEITPDEIQAFVDDLKAKGYNISVVKRPLYALKQTYQWMMRQPNSPVKNNPCAPVVITGMKQETKDLAAREDIAAIKTVSTIRGGCCHTFYFIPACVSRRPLLFNGEILILRMTV